MESPDELRNFIQENTQYIHALTREDIGSTVVKVICHKLPSGNTDLGYMCELYTVKDYTKETKVCEFVLCEKDADRRCKKCKKAYYCSEDCLEKDLEVHSIRCGRGSCDSGIVLVPVNKEEALLFKHNEALNKKYATGWMNVDKVKDINLLLLLIRKYRNNVTNEGSVFSVYQLMK